MGGIFSSPKSPEIPKTTILDTADAEKAAVKKEMLRSRKRKGRLSTILTQQTSEGTLLGS